MDRWWYTFDAALFVVGWSLGWLMLWRLRALPKAVTRSSEPTPRRSAVAVVVPARNEAESLPHLLGSLARQLRPGDEFIVVDDHSDDETRSVAQTAGAVVLAAPELTPGWLGKPNACWHGAQNTTAPVLLFVDADVRPAPDLIDRVAAAISLDSGSLVSVQPWHQTERWYEQVSVLFNVVSLMGSGAFTVAGEHIGDPRRPVAFGPVLAVDRRTYDRVGGHADRRIRAMHTEDVGLAQAIGRTRLFTGAPDTRFRMYPDGILDAARGWTRTIATGAVRTSWWASLATIAWICSLVGGWMAIPWVYPLSALQVWVLGRRAASIRPATAILYPLAVSCFVLVALWSAVTVALGRTVSWKGRRVHARLEEGDEVPSTQNGIVD